MPGWNMKGSSVWDITLLYCFTHLSKGIEDVNLGSFCIFGDLFFFPYKGEFTYN